MNTIDSNIINSSIFTNDSLLNNIDEISQPNTIITNEQIINIIIKYFFAYKFPESIDTKVPLWDIETMFWIAHHYFELLEKQPNTKIDIDSPIVIEMFDFIQTSGYPLVMLWDIAATTSIVKSITDVVIDPEIYENKYTWLDLWSGTWILLLAQYIQAKRNKFKDIENIWIELQPESAEISNVLIKNLWAWKVIQWDTTNSETYTGLFWDRLLTHVSNETISSNGIPMTWKNDPFHQNNETIYRSLKNNISASTQFFPSQIEMILKLWDSRQTIHWNHQNQFLLWPLLGTEKSMLDEPSITFPENWRIFNQLNAEWIQIDDKIIKLNEIWDHLKEQWLVKPLQWWRNRWE